MLLLALALAIAAIRRGGRPVLVFAAASLQTSLTKAAEAWEKLAGQSHFSFAGSASLARQIEEGAPADIFASADPNGWTNSRKKNLLKPGTRKTLLGNALVLITGKDEAATLAIAPGMPLAEAIGDSRLAMGNPDSVPAGRYAKEALTALGVWEAVSAKIAGTENVRAALALVARGEARFGIVYATDARVEPTVRIVGVFPEGSHAPILYPFAEVAASSNRTRRRSLPFWKARRLQRFSPLTASPCRSKGGLRLLRGTGARIHA